jgi:Phage capsid family
MALGTGQITFTNASYFLPNLWADELAVRYKKNLVIANLVDNLDHTGKYGEVVHIPTSTRGTAAQYFSTPGQAVTFTAPTTNEMQITINQWWVHGKQIPDLVEKQALPSLRKFIVNDMSYSLALAVDSYMHDQVGSTLQGGAVVVYGTPNSKATGGSVIGGDGQTVWNPASNANTGNGTDLTDDGIRRAMQNLDDNDVPGDNRYWVVPPITKRKLLAVPRFTEQAFVGEPGGENSIRNGYVGNLYGTPVYVSSNCSQFDATDGATVYRQVVYAHQSAMILVTQIKPRVQAQYKVEFLSDAIVADVAFGAAVTRSEASTSLDRGLSVIVPGT